MKRKYIISSFFFIVCLHSLYPQADTAIINLKEINSVYDDYLPFWKNSTLFFTSNRKNSLEQQLIEHSEKVYYSSRKLNQWEPVKKQEYRWNSDNNTALIGIDSTTYYYYRSYWLNNGEIFKAEKNLKKMKNICSEKDEVSIAKLNNDSLLFISNKNGNYDVFLKTKNDSIISVETLNSDYDEQDLFYNPAIKTLFFSSNRPNGLGQYDIYQSCWQSNCWTKPQLLNIKEINSSADDKGYRWYNDSTVFFSSNRTGGLGGFDIYALSITQKPDSNSSSDTLYKTIDDSLKKQVAELDNKLKELELIPFYGEVQLAAYRYISSISEFKKKFNCIENEDIRVDSSITSSDGEKIYKFMINNTYENVDEAVNKQLSIINKHCLINEVNSTDMPFVALLNKEKNRFAIFWKKDELINKKVFFIYENGKPIWKGKKF